MDTATGTVSESESDSGTDLTSDQSTNQSSNQSAGPRRMSASQLKLFEDCPRKWKFKYLDNLPDPSGLPAQLGSFAHAVLEEVMKLPPANRTLEVARTTATDTFAKTRDSDEFRQLELGPAAIPKFKQLAWASISKLWELEDPQAVEVLEVEAELSVTLDGTPFVGYVDRMDETPAGILVNDYKSGKPNYPGPNADPQRRHLEDSHIFQVMLYAAAIEQDLSDPPAEVRVLYLGENSGAITETVTPHKLADVKAKLADGWQRLNQSKDSGDFPANTTPLCGWCPFLTHCQEGMDKVIQMKDAGKLKDTAPALQKYGRLLF